MTAQSAFKRAVKALKRLMAEQNYVYRVTSGTRTAEQQAAIPSNNPYPVAAPGRSQHQYGLAVDIVVQNPEYWGGMWRDAGYGWDADDPVHFAYYTRSEWNAILGNAEMAPGSNLLPSDNQSLLSWVQSFLQGIGGG